MGRPEVPVDPSTGPVADFARQLRELRAAAGSPPYRTLATRAFFSATTLSSAAAGRRLPTLEVTLAYVIACGGDPEAWRHRWQSLAEADPAVLAGAGYRRSAATPMRRSPSGGAGTVSAPRASGMYQGGANLNSANLNGVRPTGTLTNGTLTNGTRVNGAHPTGTHATGSHATGTHPAGAHPIGAPAATGSGLAFRPGGRPGAGGPGSSIPGQRPGGAHIAGPLRAGPVLPGRRPVGSTAPGQRPGNGAGTGPRSGNGAGPAQPVATGAPPVGTLGALHTLGTPTVGYRDRAGTGGLTAGGGSGGRNRARALVVGLAALSLTALIGAAGFVAGAWPDRSPGRGTPAANGIAAVTDGADPLSSGCAEDGRTLTVARLLDSRGVPQGMVELRYSSRCRAAWARFTSEPSPAGPVRVTIGVQRSEPRAATTFTAGLDSGVIFSDLLLVNGGCVTASVSIDRGDGRETISTRTSCERGVPA